MPAPDIGLVSAACAPRRAGVPVRRALAPRRRPTFRSTIPVSRCSSISSPAVTSTTRRPWCVPSGAPMRRACWPRPTRRSRRSRARPSARQLEDPPAPERWRLAARAGAQAYSHIRRDVLHPLGPGRRATVCGVHRRSRDVGHFALVSRPAAEPRPDRRSGMAGAAGPTLAWRMVEAYASAQFKYGSVFYGQMDRNWGPVGLAGIGLSNYAYPRGRVRIQVGTRTLRSTALATLAQGRADSARQPRPPLLFRAPAGAAADRPAATSGSGRRRCSRAWTASSTGGTATR